ncbi:MAG: 3'-5' exonuclease [Bacteroidia bacterium]|nr:3'-5' exonuclease [Bacteroidia bacterium]
MFPLRKTFVALDFETANSGRHTVCAVGAVAVERGKIVQEWDTLVRPPTEDFSHSDIHGITAEKVLYAPTFSEVWRTLRPLLREYGLVIAHNAAFEKSVLETCRSYFNLRLPDLEWGCTLRLARAKLPYLTGHRLPTVCKHLRIPLGRHHDALSDARACAQVWLALV